MALRVIDHAIQAHGAVGVSARTRRWPAMYAGIRTLRLADGPDEVHRRRSPAASCAASRR